MKIPLVGGAYTDSSLSINAQVCQNFYVHFDPKGGKEAAVLKGCDGTTLFGDSLNPAEVRGFKIMDGVLYVVIGNTVYSVSTAGVFTNVSQPGTLLSSFLTTTFDVSATTPTGIDVKSDGNLLVTDSGTNKCYDITDAGSLNSSFLITDIDPYATSVTGVAEDESGDYWFSDSNTNKLYKTSSAGAIKSMIGQDIDIATYASKTFDFSTQADSAEGILFNDDGTTMWVLDVTDLEIYQYTVTGGDPSTAVYASKSMDISTESSDPKDFCANSDYSKFYVLDGGGQNTQYEPKIFQYDLTGAGDIATGSYASKSLSVNPQCGGASCIDMNYAGDKVYVAGNLPDFNTKLLLTLNNNVIDFSSDDSPHTVTNNGATFSTDSVFGSHSLDFNGSTNYLSIPDSNDFYSSDGTWTIDFRVKFDLATNSGGCFGQYVNANSQHWCYMDGAGKLYWGFQNGVNIVSITSSITFSTNTWYHVEIVENGNSFYMFIDGVLRGSTTSSYRIPNIAATFYIGRSTIYIVFSPTTLYLNGHIDEFRYSNVARRTSGFSIPTESYINDSQLAFQYTLSTPADISTGTYDDKSLTISEDDTPKGFKLSPCGSKAYLLGGENDSVYQYIMITGGDLSTGSYDSKSFSVATQEAAPTGFDFISTGGSMYVNGASDVYQYTLPLRFDSSAADLKGVSVDGDGNLWTICDTTNKAYKITTAGVLITSFLTTGFDASATSPTGIGDGWISDTNTDKLYNVDVNGNKQVEVANTVYDAAATDPQDIAVHPTEGNIWMVDNQTNKVYELQSSSLVTTGGVVYMETDGTYVVIVDQTDGKGWYVNAGTFAQIVDADFPTASSLTYQDGFFVVSEAGTNKMYSSDINDPTSWDALNFTSVDGSPDDLVRVYSHERELWCFCEESYEIFQNVGQVGFPFARIPGTYRSTGLAAAGSVADDLGALFFLGDDLNVYRSEGFNVKIISTNHISQQIRTYTTVSDAKGYAYTKDGHTFYVLNFPTEDKTWVYDLTTDEWHTRASGATDTMHVGNCYVVYANKNIIGHKDNGKLLYYDSTAYDDNGVDFRSIRATKYIAEYPNRIPHAKLELQAESGVGSVSVNPTVEMDYSDDDGNTWSTAESKNLGLSGAYNTRQIWRRKGMARNRVYRFTMDGPYKRTLISLHLNEDD